MVLEVAGFLLDFIFLKLRKQLNKVYRFQKLQLWPCISYVELWVVIKQKYLFLWSSLLYFKMGNYNDRQGWCCFIMFMFIYIMFCSRKRKKLRQGNIWISHRPAGAISSGFVFFFVSYLLVND